MTHAEDVTRLWLGHLREGRTTTDRVREYAGLPDVSAWLARALIEAVTRFEAERFILFLAELGAPAEEGCAP
jgi:hypothetical protein